ncbi:hypothetical protein GCM10017673_50170 [Streptosporangium violaceochromogenes]|nr:hypothetical protein GCM10017673_50170 [Streptosporangium violaceochromogenes]
MRAADIKPGAVYAHRAGSGRLYPVVFLARADRNHLYWTTDRFRPPDAPAFQKASGGAKPRRGTGIDRTCGYPAVVGYGVASGETTVEALTKVTLADFEAATTTGVVDGLSFNLVTSLGQIVGPWQEAVAAEAAARQEQQAVAAREWEARQAAQQRATELVEAFAALGVSARADNPGQPAGIVVSLDEADRMLKLLALLKLAAI